MTKNYMYITKYSGLPIERTGTDKTWAKIHASTLIKHITENPFRICEPVRSANIKKSIPTKKPTDQIICAANLDALLTKTWNKE